MCYEYHRIICDCKYIRVYFHSKCAICATGLSILFGEISLTVVTPQKWDGIQMRRNTFMNTWKTISYFFFTQNQCYKAGMWSRENVRRLRLRRKKSAPAPAPAPSKMVGLRFRLRLSTTPIQRSARLPSRIPSKACSFEQGARVSAENPWSTVGIRSRKKLHDPVLIISSWIYWICIICTQETFHKSIWRVRYVCRKSVRRLQNQYIDKPADFRIKIMISQPFAESKYWFSPGLAAVMNQYLDYFQDAFLN